MSWVSGNRYLAQDEMENNAYEFRRYFENKGWTLNAIAGALGNIQAESSVNPGIWQSLIPGSGGGGGYGLVQWTPWTKYSEWAGEGWEDNGDKECERIQYEMDNGIQYYSTRNYPLSASEFMSANLEPEYLAYAWMYNYERPKNKNQPKRREYARNWYDWMLGGETPPPIDPTPSEHNIPVWMLFKFKYGGYLNGRKLWIV